MQEFQQPVTARTAPKDILLDQRNFWSAPLRFRVADVRWALPIAMFTALSLGSDTAVEAHVPRGEQTMKRSRRFSNAGLAALGGTAGAMFAWGQVAHNEHLRETGLLATEAVADTFAVTAIMKRTFRRQRPGEMNGGDFWRSGNSFPSEHAAIGWALATVIAHEYPGKLTQAFAYGTAAGISATRVTGGKHYVSDVLVGSAIGWYMGRRVVRARGSAAAADTARWGTFARAEDEGPQDVASPYVTLDSWVYPAFDRLAALGYVQTAFAGQRPWTRAECARLVEEAGDLVNEEDVAPGIAESVHALRQEFGQELAAEGQGSAAAAIEALTVRTSAISGPVLRDGFHFAQTLVNDQGRPYGEGANVDAGVAFRAASGPFAAYVRAEYQRAPALASWPAAVARDIAAADLNPAAPQPPGAEISAVRLLDAYVSLHWKGLAFSFGRQSLWWGPSASGAMLLSNNAEPITMLRVDRTSPAKLPGPFGRLGPMRTQFFLGRLSGQQFVSTPSGTVGVAGRSFDPQPYMHGEKVGFRPTPNLEFSFSRTVVFGGPGFPVTLQTFWNSMVSRSTLNNAHDPGDRRSAFDFSYRLPGLRNWLTIYTDSFTDDEVSPLAFPAHAAWNPGVYLPRLPGLPKLDFRAEGMLTPSRHEWFPGFYYFNVRYHSGYTNRGMLLGNAIGREGKGLQLWSTYWFSTRNKVQAGYRKMQVDRSFLQGGRLQDFSGKGDFVLRPDLSLSATLQVERWNFPLLATTGKTNVVASWQMTYTPRWRIH